MKLHMLVTDHGGTFLMSRPKRKLPGMKPTLRTMCISSLRPLAAIAVLGSLAACGGDGGDTAPSDPRARAEDRAVDNIQNVVVIYAENRSFDNLYSDFPGVDSPLATAAYAPQIDRDGKTVLSALPPVWAGLTNARAQFDPAVPVVTTAQTQGMANKPFSINDTYPGVDLKAVNADPVAQLLSEPDADRWRQERPVRRLGR